VKFKSIFIIFNVIILISFSMIFFMPAFLLGPQYARMFWHQSWYLAVIFFLVLISLDGYFLVHWKLFSFLEKEDWSSLQSYTKGKIINSRIISSQQINLFLNSCLMLNDLSSIEVVGNKLQEKSPKTIQKYLAGFGIPVLLRHNGKEIIHFFGPTWDQLDTSNNHLDPWIGWMYSFGLLLEKQDIKAQEVLLAVLPKVKKASPLELLTYYLLKNFPDDQVALKSQNYKQTITASYSLDKWSKHMENSRDTIQVLLLQSIIKEASDWLYQDK
jgi:hypothetical protein